MSAPTIFISYRREDCAGHAGRLGDRLEEAFGPDSVFRDVEDIGAGDDFVDALHAQVDRCTVLLALIGPRWLSAADATGRRRLDNENDWVRREIARALERNIRVVPVLLQGAAMPARDALPADLVDLSRRNAVEIRDTVFARDVDHLVNVLSPGDQRLKRYRLAIAALLVALVAIGAVAWQQHREGAPDRAVVKLKRMGHPFTVAAFLDAAHEGNDRAVELFLHGGMEADATVDDRYPALVAAISGGRPAMVQSLLDHGADATDALAIAIGQEQHDIAELLLARKPTQAAAQNAFGVAAARGRVDYLERLAPLGVDPDANRGDALRSAAASLQVDALRWLLAQGAKPALAVEEDGWTALHAAAAATETNADPETGAKADEMVKLLLAAGADPNALCARPAVVGATPLMAAIRRNNSAAALRLIAAGADIHVRGESDFSPLLLAAERGLPDVVEALLARGASLDERSAKGETALMIATSRGTQAMLDLLLARGADVNAASTNGVTALMLAVNGLQPQRVEQLLAAGAQVDARTDTGATALLQLAAMPITPDSDPARTAAKIVRLLLAAGASQAVTDEQDRTPLGLAMKSGTPEIIAALRGR